MTEFSHLDSQGTARMVDIGAKPIQKRTAIASGFIRCAPATLEALRDRKIPKGDVLTVARIAAIQAAKITDRLIPLCHSLPIDKADVDFEIQDQGIAIRATVSTSAKTGIEMEALTAVSIAALTIYDMCKAVDKAMVIGEILLEKKAKE